MKKNVNLKKLFSGLDAELKLILSNHIDNVSHPTSKGDESELNWIGLLKEYLPERYKVDSGFVIDHEGSISEQIDIIIYDRNFTPIIFKGKKTLFIPAEGVYAVFEVKPVFSKFNYEYAKKKFNSVVKLKRTSVPFEHIGGSSEKELVDIFGGILTKTISSKSLFDKLDEKSELAIILCLDDNIKIIPVNSQLKKIINKTVKRSSGNIVAFFLFKLIEMLRSSASVPAMDVNKYIK